MLAGPGNVIKSTSTTTSSANTILQVPVGCDGRLWLETTSVVHQLKRQTRDGVISEVLGLPIIGWRVKIDNGEMMMEKRNKRQISDSGNKHNLMPLDTSRSNSTRVV